MFVMYSKKAERRRESNNVILSALKFSEDGSRLILCMHETDGKECEFRAACDVLPAPLQAQVTLWSVQTYYLKNGNDVWKEVLMTDF